MVHPVAATGLPGEATRRPAAPSGSKDLERTRSRCPSIQRWLRPKQKWKSLLLSKFNRPWKELLAEKIPKATSEQASVAGVGATPSDFENLHLDEDSDAESLVA